MKCERPKTKLELFFDVFKIFFKYLDNNKMEAVIFFIGMSGAMVAISIASNIEKIKKIVELIK
jgi:hypothetical protein